MEIKIEAGDVRITITVEPTATKNDPEIFTPPIEVKSETSLDFGI